MADLIDRQAAIDALADMHCKSDEDGYVWIIRSDAWGRIDALPSAQSEIIRCKDCGKREVCRTSTVWAAAPGDDWYCADAERRTDG